MNPPQRAGRIEASLWGWAAAIAAGVSAFGFALQTILDHVAAPLDFKFAEFWGLFFGDAVIGLLAGFVAIVVGLRARRCDATIAFGLIGVGWLLLAQTILVVWD